MIRPLKLHPTWTHTYVHNSYISYNTRRKTRNRYYFLFPGSLVQSHIILCMHTHTPCFFHSHWGIVLLVNHPFLTSTQPGVEMREEDVSTTILNGRAKWLSEKFSKCLSSSNNCYGQSTRIIHTCVRALHYD